MTIKTEGRISVRAHYRHAGETTGEATGEQLIEVEPFETEAAFVGVVLGRKIYQGQFNSSEVRVSVSLPCYREEVPEALDECQRLAHNKISKLIERLKK